MVNWKQVFEKAAFEYKYGAQDTDGSVWLYTNEPHCQRDREDNSVTWDISNPYHGCTMVVDSNTHPVTHEVAMQLHAREDYQDTEA